jgi:hypothetical protein
MPPDSVKIAVMIGDFSATEFLRSTPSRSGLIEGRKCMMTGFA